MYTNQRHIFSHLIDTARDDEATVIADNVDIFAFVQPANNEIQIQNMKGYVFAADADALLELVTEDDAILCRLELDATGHISAIEAASTDAQTFPIRVPAQSTTLPKLIKLRSAGELDADTKVLVEINVSGLAAK